MSIKEREIEFTERMVVLVTRWIDLLMLEELPESEVCHYGNRIKWYIEDDTHFIIKYKNIVLYDIYYDTKEELLEEISLIKGKTFLLCKCEQDVAVKDKWCKTCYIHRHVRGEDCPICMEDEGVWIELTCKHQFHLSCYTKFRKFRKCPLCRCEINEENLNHYPFNN